MAWEISWSPTSNLDLTDIVTFIAERNPAAACNFLQSIFSSVEHLAEYPELGRMVPELQDVAVRELIQPPFRIIYRVNLEGHLVEILRVWHAARGNPEL